MRQLGFFDLSRRYEGLEPKDDPLAAIAVAASVLRQRRRRGNQRRIRDCALPQGSATTS
jgi:hypothetical protein